MGKNGFRKYFLCAGLVLALPIMSHAGPTLPELEAHRIADESAMEGAVDETGADGGAERVTSGSFDGLIATYGDKWTFDSSTVGVGSAAGVSSPAEISESGAIEPIGKITIDRALYDVPVEMNEQVEAFIKYFQSSGRGVFTRWLERSGRYMPMFTEILKEKGLPEDLAYLSLIESGLNPTARSRAGAVGIWQFMPFTGRLHGLRADWWVDERRDPERATVAAAEYLAKLYDIFGSWYHALAAYNAGEGRIMRAMAKHGTSDFWELVSTSTLKRETRDYVPKYLAAMIIAKDPESYGFHDLAPQEPMSYDTVTLKRPMDVKVIAKASGATIEEIEQLNPALLRWFTPPDYKEYAIRIPEGTREQFEKFVEEMPKGDMLKFHAHKVKKGESLKSIARRYGTSVEPIMDLNNIRNARSVRAGSMIVVPVREGTRPAPEPPPAQAPKSGTYVVKKGDTLWAISSRFGVKLERVLELNDMKKSDKLKPGQRIRLKNA
jgi:membrane-bound lytic murein transglycosylase D